MTDELMTTAVCWEMDANASVSFAYTARDLFYFCPNPRCLVEVVPAKINNVFFRAPESHVSGCINEKKKTTASSIPVVPMQRHSPPPPQIIPSHLGAIAKGHKATKPTLAQMRSLAMQIQAAPALHPGTLREVVDAWWLMSKIDRRQCPLHIAARALTYFDAFGQFGVASRDIASLECERIIAFGQASVTLFKNTFSVTTWRKFNAGGKSLPIKVRVRSGDPDFAYLAPGQHVTLFLHGVTPAPDSQQKYFEMQTSNAYNGFVIKPMLT
ncbi:hypothetical protein [Pseudomonas fluorescens]|uniref:hypothetical protein n=1 Tax=Pseudomonas TaxID=286 RepID=UPI003CFF52E2